MPRQIKKSATKRVKQPTVTSPVALELLREPVPAIRHAALARIRALRPGSAVIEVEERTPFDPEGHAKAGHATVEATDVLAREHTYLLGAEIGERQRDVRVGSSRVRWKGHALEVFEIGYFHQWGIVRNVFVVGDVRTVAESYFDEVAEHSSAVHGEVLVFSNGCWNKSPELFASIQKTCWDDLILGGNLGERLRQDFDHFVAARADYDAWRIPWKRGALFVGPPGNGKTMAIRTLAKHLAMPCLYVQSFVAPRSTEEASMQQVFSRARRMTPCLIVLEDLDSLVTPGARSFFLNELDGFAVNHGMVTIGSTNHPEKLDAAIVDRPSRFDRKYHFDLPGEPERRRYAVSWNARLPDALRLDDAALDGVATTTSEFSFAYLKELFAAALMRLVAGDVTAPRFLDALREETDALRAQMKTTNVAPETTAPALAPQNPWDAY